MKSLEIMWKAVQSEYEKTGMGDKCPQCESDGGDNDVLRVDWETKTIALRCGVCGWRFCVERS